jgi:CheY-like chemotaxis protein
MRVLVVEDEDSLGEVFRDFLAEIGHDAVVVRSAEAALGALQRQPPDAILLDINLPGMSGLDFLQLRPVRESGCRSSPSRAWPPNPGARVPAAGRARLRRQAGAARAAQRAADGDGAARAQPAAVPDARPWERRRGPRAAIGFPVRVVEYKGTAWEGVCSELSATGMKVRSSATLTQGSAVKLLFTPPDGASAVEVISLVVRVEGDEAAFSFVHLANAEARRLSDIVQRLHRP